MEASMFSRICRSKTESILHAEFLNCLTQSKFKGLAFPEIPSLTACFFCILSYFNISINTSGIAGTNYGWYDVVKGRSRFQ
jgi:hypothetical protein